MDTVNVKSFFRENRLAFLLTAFLTFLVRAGMMLRPTIGIDTEALINGGTVFYDSWLISGRQGLVLLSFLTGNYQEFHMLFSGIGAMVFLWLAGIVWSYFFTLIIGKNHKGAVGFFIATLAVSAIFTEQMYFKLQAMQIFVAIFLTGVSLVCSYRFFVSAKTWWNPVLAVCLNLITFSTYQAMVPLYIFGAAAGAFLYVCFREEKRQWGFVLHYAINFLFSFLINMVMTKLFFSEGAYLSEQALWGRQSVIQCLVGVAKHGYRVLSGYGTFYPTVLAVYFIMLAVFAVKCVQEHRNVLLVIISGLMVLASPFLLSIVLGTTPVYRAQLVLPMTFAFLIFLSFYICAEKLQVLFFTILACFVLVTQGSYTIILNRLDAARFEQDARLAGEICQEILTLTPSLDNVHVAVYGEKPFDTSDAVMMGETIGNSFFAWDTPAEPYGAGTTNRVTGFMKAIGYPVQAANTEEITFGHALLSEMPCWPESGSVCLVGQTVYIKLSN